MAMTHGGTPRIPGRLPGDIWVRIHDRYYYSWGTRPDGTHRLVELDEPPWGQRVWVPDLTGGPGTTEQVPFRLRPATVFWLLLTPLTLIIVPLALSGSSTPVAIIATAVAACAVLFCALIAQGTRLKPQDDIARAEATTPAPVSAQAAHEAWLADQQYAAERHADQQRRHQEQQMKWNRALWAQQAGIHHALDPNADVWRPYGQSPPL